MNYPTLEQVERAGREQLARWSRFLPSPGSCASSGNVANFERVMEEESKIMDRILERFKEAGGWNPSLSKRVGWD